MRSTSPADTAPDRFSRIGLPVAPLAALSCFLLLPDTYEIALGESARLGHEGRATAAVAVWMAIWWMTEAIPVYATALLPLALLPLVGGLPIGEVAAPYAHEMIFLFLGGFLLAVAVQRWELDRRVALLALRAVGSEFSHIVGGMMLVTAFLSMWVSNTATTVMMLPIALSVLHLATGHDETGGEDEDRFAEADASQRRLSTCLLLGVAYAATIGGVGTLIGTPPNLFLASFARDALGIEITFVRWMGVGVPLVVVFLPLAWWLLTRHLFPVRGGRVPSADGLIRSAYARLGPLRPAERKVLGVFLLTAGAWIFRPLLPWEISDSGIAMIAALSLFVIPVHFSRGVFLMDWKSAEGLPWGVLVLFGGGLSLASAIRANGVDQWLGSLFGAGVGVPGWCLVVGVTVCVIFLTEVTSNTATAATLIPLFAALAPAVDLPALHLIVPTALAASYAFMLPVATPPNAVIFGSRMLKVRDMCRAGIWLNLVGVALITALTYAIALPLLGVG